MRSLLTAFALCLMCTHLTYGQWDITDTDIPFHLDFQDFAGTGFSADPAPGELDSHMWSVLGLGDGDLLFGDTGLSGDFARGISPGGETSAGIYAFEVSETNCTLGVQPTSSEFNPGALILRALNNTGSPIRTIDLSYEIYVYNDEDRSSELLLSYSLDGTDYATLPVSEFLSAAEADSAPRWKLYQRSLSIADIEWQIGEYCYFRFRVTDAGGEGSRDELALDTVTLTAGDSSCVEVVINEIHTDPHSGEGDANGDSVIHSYDDEFVEIVNVGPDPIDLHGFTLADEVEGRYTFPAGTLLPPEAAVVIFGGGKPAGTFGFSPVHTASSLSLNNGGDTIRLLNPTGRIVAEVAYGSEGGNDQSLTREPDIAGEFIGHTGIPAADGARFTPGLTTSGIPFGGSAAGGRTAYIESDGRVDFGDETGVEIEISGLTGQGPVTVLRFTTAPEGAGGIAEHNVSTYRWIISNPENIICPDSAVIRFRLSEIPGHGVTDGNSISIYKRIYPGQGVFHPCSVDYLPSTGELCITVPGLEGEYVFASNDQSLPVELSSFTAEVKQTGVQLIWITESEQENQGFILERRREQETEFRKIAGYRTAPQLHGAGSTAEGRRYTYTDQSVTIGNTYLYRLNSVSYQGRITFHDDWILTVPVTGMPPGNGLQHQLYPAYPNPFNTTTRITYSLPAKDRVKIILYESTGRILSELYNEQQGPGIHSLLISLPEYPSGMYFLRMETPGFRQTRKILLVK